VALLLPLSIDTFAVAAALGAAGLPDAQRNRTSVFLALLEALMPLVGVVLGRGAAALVGGVATYAAAAIIAVAGALLVRGDHDDVDLLAQARGLALVGLGLGISVDELAIGLSLGLLQLPLVVAVPYLAVQAFVAAQLGIRLGARLGAARREGAERLAGVLLLLAAAVLVTLELAGHGP
jgi:putative Mn2+ efflux pump MntP